MDILKNARILVCDDDENVLVAARHFLEPLVMELSLALHPKEISRQRLMQFDLLLMDMNYAKGKCKGEEGIHWINEIQNDQLDILIICMTNHADVETAVQALHDGANDFILKPIMREKLFASVINALKLRDSTRQVKALNLKNNQLIHVLNGPSKNIIGDSPLMEKVKRDIAKVAPTDASVLILGENGTGKDLIANEIHRQSLRMQKPYICVDLGSLNESLFESELFGHVKGAYTGANQDRVGRLELANEGTVFLDEIGNINLSQQSKLLRALENKQIVKAGSNELVSVDIRLISATNKPIYKMIEQQEFRQDLLFRINTIEIHLPSLRDRLQDIPLLLDYFLLKYGQKYGKDFKKPSQKLVEKLKAYLWPGNIREFQHLIERAVIMAENTRLEPDDFQFITSQHKNIKSKGLESLDLAELEMNAIKKALEQNKGNVSKTAQDLNISRFSLYRKMERYGFK